MLGFLMRHHVVDQQAGFEPGFTTKTGADVRGHGFGLALTRMACARHSGAVTVSHRGGAVLCAELHVDASPEPWGQADVDRVFRPVGPAAASSRALPKGLSPETAELVVRGLRGRTEPEAAADVGEPIGLPRVSTRRYRWSRD